MYGLLTGGRSELSGAACGDEAKMPAQQGVFTIQPDHTYELVRYVVAPKFQYRGALYGWPCTGSCGYASAPEYFLENFGVRDIHRVDDTAWFQAARVASSFVHALQVVSLK